MPQKIEPVRGSIRNEEGERVVRFCYYEHTGADPTILFYHTALEISVFGGRGVYNVGGTDYSYEDGDVFVLPSNTLHCMKRVDEPGYFLNLYFDTDFLWENIRFFDNRYMRIFGGNAVGMRYLLDRHHPEIDAIRSMLFRVRDEFRERRPCYEHMVKGYMILLMISVLRTLPQAQQSLPALPPEHAKDISEAVRYMDAHCCEPLRLQTIASLAYLSPSRFGVIFRQTYGMTPWEYITAKRIRLAVHRICTDPGLPMCEVARACGFGSLTNFNRIFKKYTGQNPGAYRCNARRTHSPDSEDIND